MTVSNATAPRRMRSLKRLGTPRQWLNGCPLIFAIFLAIALVDPVVGHTASGGPKIVGQMQNFELYKSTRPRPNFQWQDEQGQPVSLTNFAGKVVLFNFWATWCVPCIRELPSLDRLNAKLGGDKFTVVTLNIDRAGKPVALKMVKRLKLKTLRLYLNPKLKISRALGVKVMPSTFLFDAKGRELGKLEGAAEWDAPEAIDFMRYFIDRPGYAERLPSIGRVTGK